MWAADSGYSPTGSTTSTTSAIANTTSDPLYQDNRGWNPGVTGQYQFTVPNGSYNVTLKWAEFYNGGSPRIFNVTINGTQVLTNFNEGQYWLTAFDQTFTTTATAGLITIQFSSTTAAPTINETRDSNPFAQF